MSLAGNKEIGRFFFEEVIGKERWDAAKEVAAPEMVMHHPSSPAPVAGLDAVVGFLTTFRTGFPDGKMVVEDAFGEGDQVAIRWRFSGTHTGVLFGVPPTGKTTNVMGISLMRITDGKIVEDYVSEDSLGMFQQLGLIPAQ